MSNIPKMGQLPTPAIHGNDEMGMDQYLLIPFLGGWTSINPSYFDVHQAYKVLTHPQICGESAGTGWTLDGEAMRSWWIHRIFPSISEISGKSENPNYQCPWLWLGGIFFHDFPISLTIKISGWWFGVFFLIHDIWESSSQLTKSIIFQEG